MSNKQLRTSVVFSKEGAAVEEALQFISRLNELVKAELPGWKLDSHTTYKFHLDEEL